MLLKEAIHPLENLQQFYSLFYLIQEGGDDHSYICQCFNEIFGTNLKSDVIGLFLSKFLYLFKIDKTGLDDLFTSLSLKAKNRKQFLMPPVSKCIYCHFILFSDKFD